MIVMDDASKQNFLEGVAEIWGIDKEVIVSAAYDREDGVDKVLDIFETLYSYFRDQEAERSFLREMRKELSNKSVLGILNNADLDTAHEFVVECFNSGTGA